jgi:hypothetical protein
MVTDKGIERVSGFRVVGKNGHTAEREDVTLMDHKVQLHVGGAKAWPRCRVQPVYISALLQTNKVSSYFVCHPPTQVWIRTELAHLAF